jgi:hypothetical protein
MDPYLEDQGRWPDFHAGTITYCCDALNDCLPDDYVAQMGEEVRVDEVRDTWIEIRRLPDERLVTMIETLWPRNKGLSGLTDYLEKLHRLRTQGVNLVEIDLLIAGRRLPMAKPLLPGHFFAIVCRASKSETGDVYACRYNNPCRRFPSRWKTPTPTSSLIWPRSSPWPTSVAATRACSTTTGRSIFSSTPRTRSGPRRLRAGKIRANLECK